MPRSLRQHWSPYATDSHAVDEIPNLHPDRDSIDRRAKVSNQSGSTVSSVAGVAGCHVRSGKNLVKSALFARLRSVLSCGTQSGSEKPISSHNRRCGGDFSCGITAPNARLRKAAHNQHNATSSMAYVSGRPRRACTSQNRCAAFRTNRYTSFHNSSPSMTISFPK